MTDLVEQLRYGGNLWFIAPGAVALGALHGLEPGHSKTMMAAFIVAVRGTVTQAVLLGLSATISHTAVVWLVAMAGLYFGDRFSAESVEPYLQLVSGVIVIGIALWMFFRIRRTHTHGHDHSHDHGHHHHGHDHRHAHHHDGSRVIDTGHGVVRLEIDEAEGRAPHFRLHPESRSALDAYKPGDVSLETERADGTLQAFRFVARDGFYESTETIPEPHAFVARLSLSHGRHAHDFDVEFTEDGHIHPEDTALEVAGADSADPHERAHANDIRRRFANRNVTTGQIVLFGLTGGLIPCPASVTVLLLCLQLKKVTLGATLVLCFSLGLALTLVLSGVIAALSVKHFSKRWSGFGALSKNAPYLSAGLMILVGLYMAWHGVSGLSHGHDTHTESPAKTIP